MIFSMLASATYHLFNVLSRRHLHKLLRMDLIGIGTQIFSSSIMAFYVGFHNYRNFRMGFISILIGSMMLNGIL
jgi:predicted membrane channel-forming protein YqfA (hemolysin III family)